MPLCVVLRLKPWRKHCRYVKRLSGGSLTCRDKKYVFFRHDTDIFNSLWIDEVHVWQPLNHPPSTPEHFCNQASTNDPHTVSSLSVIQQIGCKPLITIRTEDCWHDRCTEYWIPPLVEAISLRLIGFIVFSHIKAINRDQIISFYQWRKSCKTKWSCTHFFKDWKMFNFIKVGDSWFLCHEHNWFWHFITPRAIILSFFCSWKQKSKLGFWALTSGDSVMYMWLFHKKGLHTFSHDKSCSAQVIVLKTRKMTPQLWCTCSRN